MLLSDLSIPSSKLMSGIAIAVLQPSLLKRTKLQHAKKCKKSTLLLKS